MRSAAYMRFGVPVFASLLLLAASGCASSKAAGPSTVLVVGLQGEEVAATVTSVHYTVRVGGVTTVDTTADVSKLPLEEHVAATGDPAALVEVLAEGLLGGTPIVTRRASSHFVAGQTRLLRVRLEARCEADLTRGAPAQVACDAPLTCIAGACAPSDVPVTSLEDYAAGWPDNAPDACKPAGHGAPVVQVGRGQNDFLPLSGGETVELEKGPQGGHHVWIAVRMKNLKQVGSTTTVTAVQPDTGLTVPAYGVAFGYQPDQGSFCKIYGLTFRLDSPDDLAFYKRFLGKPLDITVEVKDKVDSSKAQVSIVVAPLLTCPAGDTDPMCKT